MADTGDHFPAPDGGARIKRSDLRVECMGCGGTGREFRRVVENFGNINHQHVTTRDMGPCKGCAGMARLYPRKLPG